MKNKRKQNNNWKPHKCWAALLITLGCLATSGIGVGIGYAVWHNKNSNPDPIPPTPPAPIEHIYTLERSATVLDWNRDPTKSLYTEFTMKVDGVAIYDPANVMLSIDAGSDYVTIDTTANRITYTGKDVGGVKTPVYNTLPIDVTATYDGHTAATYIVLDDFEPTNVLEPNDPAWENLFKTSSGTLNSDNIVSKNNNNWLQQQNQYDTIDLSCFTSISSQAFQGCPSLNSAIGTNDITISFENFNATSLKSIGDDAFRSCVRITNLILPNTTETNAFSIGTRAFQECANLKKVSLPSGISTASISIGNNAFSWCTELKNFVLPNANISIGLSAFSYCTNLETLSLPEVSTFTKITSIGTKAFGYCASLTKEGIQKLGDDGSGNPHIDTNVLDYAGNGTGVSIKGAAIFMKVWGIATILASGDLGDKLNNYFTSVIRGYAFNSCASLTDIDLSSATATSFDGGAVFYDCWKLLTVKLPVGITSITDGNFRNCAALTDLYWYYGQIPSFGSQVFENCATNGVLHVTSAYATAQGISTDSPVTNWSTLSGWTYDVIMS